MVGFAYSAHPVSYYPLRAKSGFDHFTGEVLEIRACARPARRTTGAFFDGYRNQTPAAPPSKASLVQAKGLLAHPDRNGRSGFVASNQASLWLSQLHPLVAPQVSQ